MKVKTIAGICVVVFCGLIPSRLSAETWLSRDLENKWRTIPWRLGPLRLQLNLTVRDAGYDSNVYGNLYAPVRDYSLTAGPELKLYWPVHNRVLFYVSESPQYVYFLKMRRERTWNNYFTAEGYYALNRLLWTLGTSQSTAKSRVTPEIDIRSQIKQNSVYGSLLFQASPKTSVLFRYTHNFFGYENFQLEGASLRDRLDRNEDLWNAKFHYQLSPQKIYFVDVQYGIYNFVDSQSQNDALGYAVRAGVDYTPSEKVNGSISLGYKTVQPLKGGRRNYGGFIADTKLSFRVLRIFKARLTLLRDMPFSFIYSDTYFLLYQVGAGLSMYPSLNIRLDYDYYYAGFSYPEIGPSRLVSNVMDSYGDTYDAHSVGIIYRLKKNIGLGMTVGAWRRRFSYLNANSVRYYVFANLTYDF